MKLKLIPLLIAATLLLNGVFSHKTEDSKNQQELDDRKLTPEQIKKKEQHELYEQ